MIKRLKFSKHFFVYKFERSKTNLICPHSIEIKKDLKLGTTVKPSFNETFLFFRNDYKNNLINLCSEKEIRSNSTRHIRTNLLSPFKILNRHRTKLDASIYMRNNTLSNIHNKLKTQTNLNKGNSLYEVPNSNIIFN